MLNELTPREIMRFWAWVLMSGPDECWPWLSYVGSGGYGQITIRQKIFKAHRVAWALTNKQDPGRMLVMHSCDNPICVNPAHLSIGTASDNQRDSWRKGRRPIPRLQGEQHGRAKLTEVEVRAIRAALLAGATPVSLAATYGITAAHIREIGHRKTWKHLL